MNKKTVAVSTGVAISTIALGALTYLAMKKGKNYVEKVRNWKKEKLQDMYYNSITEKDVIWG